MSRVTLRWYGAKVAAALSNGGRRGAKEGAEHLLAVSQRVVPLEWGDLQRSGTVVSLGEGYSVSYGGSPSKSVIAIVQHEDFSFRHSPGRTAKYLEGPMLTEAGVIFLIMAREARQSISKG